MGRLTKLEIEHKLRGGESISWQDANKKGLQFALDNPKKRRLFAYLLKSKVREASNLADVFISGLSTAYDGVDDPKTSLNVGAKNASCSGPWKLQSIETEGFGGINAWKGPPFHFDCDQESLLVEGPNGSGKSSLIGAILWALTGERPRDQSKSPAHEPKPVFADSDKPAGDWPPVACYPPSVAELQSPPRVRVTLTFSGPTGQLSQVERVLEDGKLTAKLDPILVIPSILLEAGLLMPSRLAQLRLDDGKGRLTDAVQTLTGLDDLIAIGNLAEGLCHKGREYLSSKGKELVPVKKEFDQAIAKARDALSTVEIAIPDFAPVQTDDPEGAMAIFGKTLTERAAELTRVVSSDLAGDLRLETPSVQHQVITAIGSAKDDLKSGLAALPSWKTFETIASAMDEERISLISSTISVARHKSNEAIELLEKSRSDSKYQLKAIAAQWHSKHRSGEIVDCPLCEHELSDPILARQLEELRSAGETAVRTFDDNINAILAQLEHSIPPTIKKYSSEVLKLTPRAGLVEDIRATFVTKERYATILVKFGKLVDAALIVSPDEELGSIPVPSSPDPLKGLAERISVIERLVGIAEWFRVHSTQWSDWWKNLSETDALDIEQGSQAKNDKTESLSAHLSRLSDALAKAEPFRKGAEAMRDAWKSGKSAATIEKELNRRKEIAECLVPLKSLGPLAESIAREAIEGLSGRIADLVKQIHLSEQFQFHDARLDRREGLIVRGAVMPTLRIDATLVANTSWLRAVLWAFIFALREEGIEQIGSDPFPLLVFDDPQSTFDATHRRRWAQYIASLQTGPSKAQILIVTYDESFLDLIKVDGVTGRQAMIASALQSGGNVGMLEGESLDRKWAETQSLNTPKAGCEYIGAVRVYAEGMLRLLLRGEDALVSSVVTGFVLGASRERISQLNEKGIPPWNRPQFKKLAGALDKNLPSIKYMEMSHHAGGASLGMSEAQEVELHWRKKVGPALNHCFRLAREYHLLHGGLKALHAPPSVAVLPDGYQKQVQTIPLRVLGRAAALSDGRVADGLIDLNEFDASAHKSIVLGRHLAYRLTAPTLEPVARQGDILLVKEPGEPSAKSLVVVLSDDRVLARRFEIAENHSDVAVLTAQAINPRQIAPPVIAHKSTLTIHKIIGVIYGESTWGATVRSEMEVSECGGESVLTALAANSLGLVEVVGHSAEPHALNGQYLIVKKEISGAAALKTLNDRPIIAGDSEGNRYFKRLRIVSADQIVLESLDNGGDYGPIVLAQPGKHGNCLERVWPVAGVLFELPG